MDADQACWKDHSLVFSHVALEGTDQQMLARLALRCIILDRCDDDIDEARYYQTVANRVIWLDCVNDGHALIPLHLKRSGFHGRFAYSDNALANCINEYFARIDELKLSPAERLRWERIAPGWIDLDNKPGWLRRRRSDIFSEVIKNSPNSIDGNRVEALRKCWIDFLGPRDPALDLESSALLHLIRHLLLEEHGPDNSPGSALR